MVVVSASHTWKTEVILNCGMSPERRSGQLKFASERTAKFQQSSLLSQKCETFVFLAGAPGQGREDGLRGGRALCVPD